MRFLLIIFYSCIALILLIGCSDNNELENNSIEETLENEILETNETEESDTTDQKSVENQSDNLTSENSEQVEENEENQASLSQYSSEQIEYARIWLQLGPNQELDEFYVEHIPAGEALNPNDETSANYPEDVIQLSGSRLVDGSITYSGNGDGTINIYNVPLRWDGVYPAGEEFYLEIIENTEHVSIDPGNDEEIIGFIKQYNF